nr:NAD(P)H-binding protein [Micromonospora terminaliae]
MGSGQTVAVFGAYGHTGRFVVRELRERGSVPLLVGRDPVRLEALTASHPGLEHRVASAGDPASLDRALRGADAVVNCAGPFASTAAPVIEAALRAGIRTWTWPRRSRPTSTRSRTSPTGPGPPASRWSRRWPSSAGSATCWSPRPWATGRRPTRRTWRTG